MCAVEGCGVAGGEGFLCFLIFHRQYIEIVNWECIDELEYVVSPVPFLQKLEDMWWGR